MKVTESEKVNEEKIMKMTPRKKENYMKVKEHERESEWKEENEGGKDLEEKQKENKEKETWREK